MISTKYISGLLIFLTTATNVVLGGYSPAACHPMPGQTPGFNAKLYYYPYANLEYSHETEFLAGGYQSILTPGPVVTGVTDPFFKIVWTDIPFYPSWKSDNFSMELTGYYVAPQTGLYRLSYKVDDAGIIFFGSGAAFDCCTQETSFQSVDATIINQYDTKAPTNKELYLEEGYAYPIRIFFTNALYDAQNQLAVTLPDGTVDNNIGTSVYSSPDKLAANCDPISISHSFTTVTSSQTLTSSNCVSTLSNLVKPTTYSTYTTTSFINDDHPVIQEIFLVATPCPVTNITSNTHVSTTVTASTNFPLSTTGTDDIASTSSAVETSVASTSSAVETSVASTSSAVETSVASTSSAVETSVASTSSAVETSVATTSSVVETSVAKVSQDTSSSVHRVIYGNSTVSNNGVTCTSTKIIDNNTNGGGVTTTTGGASPASTETTNNDDNDNGVTDKLPSIHRTDSVFTTVTVTAPAESTPAIADQSSGNNGTPTDNNNANSNNAMGNNSANSDSKNNGATNNESNGSQSNNGASINNNGNNADNGNSANNTPVQATAKTPSASSPNHVSMAATAKIPSASSPKQFSMAATAKTPSALSIGAYQGKASFNEKWTLARFVVVLLLSTF